MQVFIARHAECESRRRHNTPATPLSPHGYDQADYLGDWIKAQKITVTSIGTSDERRARQTADRIAQKLGGIPVFAYPLLRERRRPTAMLRRAKDHPHTRAIDAAIEANGHKPKWRHSDEETHGQFVDRLNRIFALFQKHRNQLYISHTGVMKGLLGMAIMEGALTARDVRKLSRRAHIDNTGLCSFAFASRKPEHEIAWNLETWNSLAHLPTHLKPKHLKH